MLEKDSLLNERYQIESMIGQGGMSYVYRAEDLKMGRRVAIKLLKEEYCEDEEFIRKFQNEAQAAAKLNHPNIVSVYDIVNDTEKKLHYIVMELVEGITLKNYIQRKGRLNNRETIGIALQVIDGIEQAHKMGIVHRDIKPQNMIVGTDGVVRIADFGIARAATQQTVNATVMGSVHYISPEQARSGIADERSDIYSFGCTLYEMLTGKVPYDGETSVAVVFSHLENPIPRVSEAVSEVYPALDKAVYKCMMKRSKYRYQHIGELSEDLQRALEDPEGDFLELPGEMQEETENNGSRETGRKSERRELRYEKEENSIEDKMSKLYRGIALVCILMIVALVLFLGIRLFRFIRSGMSIKSTTVAASEMSTTMAPSSSAETVSITISALETRLPNIIGMSFEEAENYLRENRITLREEKSEFSDSYEEGKILSYPDGSYKAGDILNVTVSAGPQTLRFFDPQKPEELTELHERDFSELQEELEKREIPYSFREEFSEEVPEGNVISVNKPDSSGAEELRFTVSRGSGENRVLMPDILGYSETDAEKMLGELSLSIGEISLESSTEVEAGLILWQSIEEGTVVERDSSVDIIISSGDESEISDRRHPSTEYWYGSLNQKVKIGTGGPGVHDTMLVLVRLRQDINGESIYTTLQSARSYNLGTELQVIFSRIPGAEGVPNGVVEVVDAENDTILQSFDVAFAP